jgi:predicted Zn-dependent protease
MELILSNIYTKNYEGLVPVNKEKPEAKIINRSGMNFYRSDFVLNSLSKRIKPEKAFIVGLMRLDKYGDNERFLFCKRTITEFKAIHLEV